MIRYIIPGVQEEKAFMKSANYSGIRTRENVLPSELKERM